MKPILILKTGQTVSSIPAERGDFEQWIIDGMALPAENFHIVPVYLGEEIPAASRFGAVIITGSPAMVTDDLEWVRYSEQFLLDFMALQRPVLGICFGHQLLAQALGGTVGWHPQGREVGTTSVTLSDHASGDLLFNGMPPSFPVHVSHMQSVLSLPEKATILAGNDFDSHHGVRFRELVWGIQFHPEFDETIMRSYISDRRENIAQEGLDPDALLADIKPAMEAYGMLRKFAAICRQSPFGQTV